MKRNVVVLGLGMVLGLSALSALAQEAGAPAQVVDQAGAIAPQVDAASSVKAGDAQATITAPTGNAAASDGAQQGAETAAKSTAVAPAGAQALPEGVITEQNPLKQEFLAKSSSKRAVFRPSDNMPEIVNEDMLRGMSESGKTQTKSKNFIGYMPKLKVLPCAKGCEGKDYDRAVSEFLKGYRGDGKFFKERGEMVVQVRWYNTRPFLQRQLPYGSDLFGVSFALEGKKISLGMKSGVGVSVSSYELSNRIGAALAMELAFTLGMGVQPTYISATNTSVASGFGNAIMVTGATIDGMLGVEDVRSRIEPMTEADKALLPAIDGIAPNEIAPIDKAYYINTLLL